MKKKIIAFFMAFVMLFCMTFSVGAASERSALATMRIFDKAWDVFADAIVAVLQKTLFSADSFSSIYGSSAFPTVDEYFAEENDYFYEGSDGEVTGTSWKLGYSSESIIPESWRRDADGKADADGMNLNGGHYFGGYFGSKVDKIYDDERVYLTILSTGSDANKNGKDDIIIIGAVDNIGVANGNVRTVRKAVSDALAKKGLSNDDIVAFELNSTHAHTVVEALGMGIDDILLKGIYNHFLHQQERGIEKELIDTLCNNAAKAATEAFDNMEDGKLYYFETDNADDYMYENAYNENPDKQTIKDKLDCGADCQKFFACWYFESVSGTKTVLANAGLHPTFAGRSSEKVCADVPYYMWKSMQEAGYQFQFIQGSQAAIGLNGNYTEAGYKWATENALTYEDWVERYGKDYADERYQRNDKDWGEEEYFGIRATGYSLAHFIIESIDTSNETAPVYDVKMAETVIPLDYGIMYVAAESALFGYNTVKLPDSETGYGIVTEIGYVQLGKDVAMLMLPGEVSPAITFGGCENSEGKILWQGDGSWTGEKWEYDSLEDYAKAKLGSDKRILAMGLANDEIGYVMPDTDCAENFLTKTLLASKGGVYERGDNEELMEASRNAGSALVEGYIEFFK